MEHPYYPRTLHLPDYVPNQRSTPQLLISAGTLFSALILFCVLLSRLSGKTTSVPRFTWFLICGMMHIGFEGYWLYYKDTISSRSDLLAEMWKEYALGDSRYLAADDLLITLEIMTATVWSFFCLVSAHYIYIDSPLQYLFQLVASLCHLFSCSLYYIMDLPTAIHCNPHPLYFWVYFISFNAPWIIVPCLITCQSCQKIIHALLKTKLD
ncbi:Emopamil-binding protein [Backusella circina FSU 941]|nr:Emopamil-binding protein [Backusella circina FSU 941]